MPPIEDLPIASMTAVRARDREGWLALFEPGATVEDPVGGHPHYDPEGQGRRGREAIGRFYDMFSAVQAKMDFEVHHLVACGQEVVAYVTMRFEMIDGTASTQKMINLYKASPAGRIESLRSFWR